jgi:hypothetical protein
MPNPERGVVSRKNAAKSTGPRTVAGKARSRLNATKHGLRSPRAVLPGESEGQWEAFRSGVVASLSPSGRLEEELAGRAALCLWRLRRVAAFEAGVIGSEVGDVIDAPAGEEDAPLSAILSDSRHDDARRALELKREVILDWRGTHELFRRLPGLPDDAPLGGADVEGFLSDISGEGPGGEECFDYSDKSFLSALGIPAKFTDAPDKWGGWTAGKLRQAVALAAAGFGTTPERLLADAAASRAEAMAGLAEEEARLEEEVRRHERKEARRRERKACAALMPDARTLDKLMRYESHIGRQLAQALHTLERLQKARSGQDVPPPQALDVTVDAGP